MSVKYGTGAGIEFFLHAVVKIINEIIQEEKDIGRKDDFVFQKAFLFYQTKKKNY